MRSETLWCIHITIVPVQHNNAFFCVAELQVRVN